MGDLESNIINMINLLREINAMKTKLDLNRKKREVYDSLGCNKTGTLEKELAFHLKDLIEQIEQFPFKTAINMNEARKVLGKLKGRLI